MTHSGKFDVEDGIRTTGVLIPLLLDDPLWEVELVHYALERICLNPSFAG